MRHTISSGLLTVSVESKGAELASVVSRKHGTEFIWEADPEVWGRHAPVLFPIVGKLKDNRYRYAGRIYQMSQHGFARDREFRLIESDPCRLVFELRDDEQSRACYPFEFSLRTGYHVTDSSVTIAHAVTNRGASDMFFSIGAHPGFRCPIASGESFTDYELRFSHRETAARWYLQNGLLSRIAPNFLNGQDALPLTASLFDADALVFKGLESNTVSLLNRRTGRRVDVQCPGFPYLGIWTKPLTERFVCIEPWYGIADSIDFSGTFDQKEGIRRLSAGEIFRCQYVVSFE